MVFIGPGGVPCLRGIEAYRLNIYVMYRLNIYVAYVLLCFT